jgi:hypothetical protein
MYPNIPVRVIVQEFNKNYKAIKYGLVFFFCMSLLTSRVLAQETPAQPAAEPKAQSEAQPKAEPAPQATAEKPQKATGSGDDISKTISDLKAALEQQKKQIDALEARQTDAGTVSKQQADRQQKIISDQTKLIETQRQATQSLQTQLDQMSAAEGQEMTAEEKELRSRLETLEGSIKSSQNAESTSYDIDSFPGSIALPGSSAAIRIGGFVKVNVVASLDPIGTDDRFIAGSIPVPYDGGGSTQSKINASQSRLNIDLRDNTPQGPFRAFIEGDFDGDNGSGNGENLRLRHAFGQYRSLLAGKTWTAFMDRESIPEDLDFEGINGQILVRHAQLRFFPSIGKDWDLIFSIEDSSPEIGNGSGVSKIPDIVASVRRTWYERWHVKTAVLFRNLDADCDDCLSGGGDSSQAWGLTISGKTAVKTWDDRDNFIFQVSYGEGYSHYVNDLNSTDVPDAVFNIATGKLSTLPAFAAYVAVQKWWTESSRSNFNLGYVEVDNEDFQDPDEYKRTVRAMVNYIWSPTARVDVGGEVLVGKRDNVDGRDGRATQIQFALTYRY